MNHRNLGRTGLKVSEVSLGTWQVGGGWGQPFSDDNAEALIEEAIERGVTFIDTADVYDDGKSEAAVGRVVRRHQGRVAIASKCGRRVVPHVNAGYTPEVLRGYVEDSLRNTGLDRIDLIQLHCPPTDVYYRPEIFELFERLVQEGKVGSLGVSVEKVEEAMKAILFPNVATVQIIFNIFRMRPREDFFQRATEKGVGVIVRVPLASGLLSGKYTRDTTFAKGDHRAFNRNGEAFDKGETFSGVPYEVGLDAVEALRSVVPHGVTMAQTALRWILDHPAVSTVIPGASRVEQLEDNLGVSELPPLSMEAHDQIDAIYREQIYPYAHLRW